MKFTLLEIVQDILNDIDGDEVDSISDTTEATQIANIVRSTYWHIVSENNLLQWRDMFNLTESSDNDAPVLMTVPTHVLELDWVKYDKKTSGTDDDYQDVQYMAWDDFIDRQNTLDTDETYVSTMTVTTDDSDTWELKYQTDRHPQYWSTPDGTNIYFNSIYQYESNGTLAADPFATTNTSATVTVTHAGHGRVVGDYVTFSGADAVGGLTVSGPYLVASVPTSDTYTITDDETATSTASGGGSAVTYFYHTDIDPFILQGSNSSCYGMIKPTFELSDSFTPDLEAEYFNWFIEEAKSAASLKLRQVQDPKAEQRARRGWVRSMPDTYTSNNYGRK